MTSERLVVCASHSPGKERDVEHAFGRRFRSALTSAAERAQQFDPDVVIVFGGDHRRAFRHVVPAFGVALSASILAEGGQLVKVAVSYLEPLGSFTTWRPALPVTQWQVTKR